MGLLPAVTGQEPSSCGRRGPHRPSPQGGFLPETGGAGGPCSVSMQPARLDTGVARVRPAATVPHCRSSAPASCAACNGHGLGASVPGCICWCHLASCRLGSIVCARSGACGHCLPRAVGLWTDLEQRLAQSGGLGLLGAAITKYHRWELKTTECIVLVLASEGPKPRCHEASLPLSPGGVLPASPSLWGPWWRCSLQPMLLSHGFSPCLCPDFPARRTPVMLDKGPLSFSVTSP